MAKSTERRAAQGDRDRLYLLADKLVDVFSGELGIFAGTARQKARQGIAGLSDDEAREVAEGIRDVICR